MERLPVIAECYGTWWELQCQVNDFYFEQERQRPPLSRQKEFRAIKNAVIREAELIYDESGSLEERDEAVEELRSMAKDGDPYTQYLLGKLYRDGPLLIPDTKKARDWFTRAAEQEL